MNRLEIQRNIFDIFENARVLFNDYYNGFYHNYTDEDKKIILSLLNMIGNDIDNIKELFENDSNL